MNHVRIVEMGPRDGLQNESRAVPLATKLALIERLAAAGLQAIEATAFVSPKWVPQMADHAELMGTLARHPGVTYPVLTPNLKGYEAAVAAGADHVAIFVAATESFSQRNTNCSVAEAMSRFEPIMARAAQDGVKVRGYVSCVVGCPYEGAVDPQQVALLAEQLMTLGCYEVSLGDTIGVGTPASVQRLLDAVTSRVPMAQLAGHFHDTYGMGVANVHASYQLGLRCFDSSVAGLGGCPYAKGATGNVATEDLVYLFDGLGVHTGIDLAALVNVGDWISRALDRPNASRAGRALMALRAGAPAAC